MSDDPSDRTVTVVSTPALARSRSAVPVLTDTPPDADADLKRLLARRLRQAFLIISVIYTAFLIRQLLLLSHASEGTRAQTILLAVALMVQGTIATIVWARRASYGRWLQTLEWVSLFTFWITQGLNQLFAMMKPDEVQVLLGNGEVGQVLTANTWLLPWFAVVAGYPVLVPNTVRRTAIIVSVTAVMPVLVTVLASVWNPYMTIPRSPLVYAQFILWGLIAGSIAVYGASQAALLRKEAFEAKKFGQYRLVRRLDGGGMGEVFLAEHQLLRRPSVIKLIRPDRRTDPKMLKRFEREVKMLATLTHWNTVEVYDYGHTAAGTFYFVMEYLPGVNQSELVKRYGRLPPGRAVFLIRQVCRGLREAHQVGLIHRDVKPANVMACDRGGLSDVAKLLDFGLVQGPAYHDDDDKITREGAILGTPAYLAPEQAAGDPLDARCDVYSLGCTLYYLLTGKPPFEASGAMAVVAAHLHQPPPYPEVAPDDVAAVVLKCLEKKPNGRYASVRELDDALAACRCAAEWDHDRADEWWQANREA